MAERSPTARSRQGPGASYVVSEREGPGLPQIWFLLAVLGLGVAVAAITITLGLLRGPTIHAERVFLEAGGAWAVAVGILKVPIVRILMGVIAGATVVATGFVGRRFTHSATMGMLAAVLVALDPALLVDGQLAVPATVLRFAAVSSLALALGGHPVYHWLTPIPVVIGALLEPTFLLWGLALAMLILFRGHIFVAPKHLRSAIMQGFGISLLLFVPAYFVLRSTIGIQNVACGASYSRSMLLLEVPHYAPGIVSLTNPVVVLGGLAVLAAMAFAAVFQVLSSFRLARLPGRIQVRLPGRLGRTPSRALWLALFALLIPGPPVAVIIGAVAIALGIQTLSDDSKSFGATVAAIAILFSAVVAVRLTPVIAGIASADTLVDSLAWLPWVNSYVCSPIG
jgi:hypothetical protein